MRMRYRIIKSLNRPNQLWSQLSKRRTWWMRMRFNRIIKSLNPLNQVWSQLSKRRTCWMRTRYNKIIKLLNPPNQLSRYQLTNTKRFIPKFKDRRRVLKKAVLAQSLRNKSKKLFQSLCKRFMKALVQRLNMESDLYFKVSKLPQKWLTSQSNAQDSLQKFHILIKLQRMFIFSSTLMKIRNTKMLMLKWLSLLSLQT